MTDQIEPPLAPPTPPAAPEPEPASETTWRAIPPTEPLPKREPLPEVPPGDVDPQIIYQQGVALEAEDKPGEAAQLYAIALSIEPEHGPYLLARGRVLLELKTTDEAIAHLLAAMEAKQVEAAWLLGQHYEERLGQPERGLFYFEACAGSDGPFQNRCREKLEIYGLREPSSAPSSD